MNLMMLAEMAAQGFGDRTAFVNGNDRLTYAELFRAAGAAAAQARASGAEHIAVLDISSLAVPVGLFASAWAGLPFVPLNYRLTDPEIEALIERVTPAYLVTQEERVGGLSKLKGTTVVTREAFLEGARTGDPLDPEWSMEAEDIAVLLFTSGTTGVPKAAVLRHKHLVSYILGSVEFGGRGRGRSHVGVSVPPYHIAGIASILSSVYAGRRIVQLPAFDGGRLAPPGAHAKHVTHAFVVPTMLARIIDALERQRPDAGASEAAFAWRTAAVKHAASRSIERAMRHLPGYRFHERLRAHRDELHHHAARLPRITVRPRPATSLAVRRRLVSVGRALPVVEVEVRDEDGKPRRPPACAARSTCAASRCPASTWAAAAQLQGGRLVPHPRRRLASTRRATCSSRDASTTSSCAAARTCRPARSRT